MVDTIRYKRMLLHTLAAAAPPAPTHIGSSFTENSSNTTVSIISESPSTIKSASASFGASVSSSIGSSSGSSGSVGASVSSSGSSGGGNIGASAKNVGSVIAAANSFLTEQLSAGIKPLLLYGLITSSQVQCAQQIILLSNRYERFDESSPIAMLYLLLYFYLVMLYFHIFSHKKASSISSKLHFRFHRTLKIKKLTAHAHTHVSAFTCRYIPTHT